MLITDPTWHKKLVHQDARHRLFISLGIAAVVYLALLHRVHQAVHMVVTWDVFTLTFLVMAWAEIASSTPKDIRRNANDQDPGRRFVFIFALGAACASLLAVLMLLHSAKQLKGIILTAHLGLALLAVVGSWLLIHTGFAFRYAHMYYNESDGPDPGTAPDKQIGGLDFPGNGEPDYLDFAYFSYVIGMTFQVSDVEISDRHIRRWALLHSMLSFAFNTVIVALSINIISGMIS